MAGPAEIGYGDEVRDESDESLMRAYANGDMEAFEMLYRRHSAPLYRFILRQVSDEATANDLYQGSWEKIIKARKRYRPTAPFSAWMYRIARNHLIDHFRSYKPVGELPDDMEDATTCAPTETIYAEERSRSLRAAIGQLPPEQRDAILLKLEGGLSLKEIAAATGVNPETAKSRLRYAVARLKNRLPVDPAQDTSSRPESGTSSP